MKTTPIAFNSYYKEVTKKVQIYLHHTAGGPNAKTVFQGWEANPERIATCVVIDASGEIVQGYGSEYWAYHLGLKNDIFKANALPYVNLDKCSIGIEICCWGQLTKKGAKYYNYVGGEVDVDEVVELSKPYKGFKYFHHYTDAQIESVKSLLLHWKDKYDIDITYHEDIWDISKRALSATNGVFTHNSVRKDKIDVYPNPKLIEMLKSL
jgi:N-acetyl-anhydromuramyl-L-alanine amidase AmpD